MEEDIYGMLDDDTLNDLFKLHETYKIDTSCPRWSNTSKKPKINLFEGFPKTESEESSTKEEDLMNI